jgi:hypothetical protein
MRCAWPGNDELMILYHDQEWGVPVHDDRNHFEFLVLDGAQAGLSWRTVLHKRESYRRDCRFRSLPKSRASTAARCVRCSATRGSSAIASSEGAIKNARHS